MRVMFVVTHLLGTGHLSRVSTLAQAFHAAGHPTLIVSGGRPAKHLEPSGVGFAQLPPLQSDGVNFTRLLADDGSLASNAYLSVRKQLLLAEYDAFSPDILITELFPFGRRNLRDEFTALLAHKSDQTLALCSVRDILAPPSKPEKALFAKELIKAHYKAVLVHGDQAVTPLSESWPVDDDLEPFLRYTGFVAKNEVPAANLRSGILVSTGGGNVGEKVFETCIDAARALSDIEWTLLVGGSDQRREAFAKVAPRNVSVEPLRNDFRELLAGSVASVSLAGYNTALDLLQSGTPSVLIPFDDGDEVEQTIRARALSKLAAFTMLKQSDLNSGTLVKAINEVITHGPRPPMTRNMSGATRTLDICEDLIRRGV